jgi:hypothetical protein
MVNKILNTGLVGVIALGLSGCGGPDAEEYVNCFKENVQLEIRKQIPSANYGDTKRDNVLYARLRGGTNTSMNQIKQLSQEKRDHMYKQIENNIIAEKKYLEITQKGRETCSQYYDETNRKNQILLEGMLRSEKKYVENFKRLPKMLAHLDSLKK